jgi:thiol:disulfide interchange protein DsbD
MVTVKVDATNNTPEIEALLKEYSVIGLPTLIVLDSEGNEISDLRMVGDITAEQLATNLSSALH